MNCELAKTKEKKEYELKAIIYRSYDHFWIEFYSSEKKGWFVYNSMECSFAIYIGQKPTYVHKKQVNMFIYLETLSNNIQ